MAEYNGGASGLISQVNNNEATLNALTSFDVCDVVSIAVLDSVPTGTYYKDEPNWNDSENKWIFGTWDKNAEKWVPYTDRRSSVTTTYCYAVATDNTYYKYSYNEATQKWNRATMGKTGSSIAGVKAVSDANKAQIDMIANWRSTLVDEDGELKLADVVAGVQSKADAQGAYLSSLASYDLCDVVKFEVLSAKPSGTYYTQKPNWDSANNRWKFATYNSTNKSWTNYTSNSWSSYTEPASGTDTNSYYSSSGTANTYYQYAYKSSTWSRSELGRDSSAIAGVKSVADANKAQLDAVASYSKDGKTGLAGLAAYVDANTSTLSSVADYSATDEDGKTVSGLAGLRAQVDGNKSELLNIADYTAGTNYTPTSYDDTSGKVSYGITYTIGDDESITANGTATGESRFNIRMSTNPMTVPNDVWLRATGCPPNGSDSTYYIYINNVAEGGGRDVGNGAKFKAKNGWYSMWITIKSGTAVNNLVFKPHVESVETEGLAAIKQHTSRNASSIDLLSSWQDNARSSLARIEQKADANGAYIQSTVANLDKYSVGPYSQAYGFTLEQAENILEEGTIYVPTEDKTTTAKKETYNYVNEAISVDTWSSTGKDKSKVYYSKDDGMYHYHNTSTWVRQEKVPAYTRSFIRGYLYKWGKSNGRGAWITVDKDYKSDITESSADSTSKDNASAMAVYFSTEEIAMGSNNNYGYWYTNGTDITPIAGSTATYNPYTLYKRDSYVDENGATQYHWVAVATLAGNSQSRAISQIKQYANSIESSVTGLAGEYAGTKAIVDTDHAKVESIAAWPSDAGSDKFNMAILKQHSDGNSAHLALAAVRDVDGNGKVEVDELGGAKIVLADSEGGSYIQMDADKINFNTGTYTINAKDHINLNGAVTANDNVTIDEDGKITAVNANITGVLKAGAGSSLGGWTVSSPKGSVFGNMSNKQDSVTGEYYGIGFDTGAVGSATRRAFAIGPLGGMEEDSSWKNSIFYITGQGKIVAKNAEITGTITAGSGSNIAGWVTSDNVFGKLSNVISMQSEDFYSGTLNDTYKFGIGMNAGDSFVGTDSNIFAIGMMESLTGNWDSANFRVTGKGKMYAKNAEVSGTITATSGKIANYEINGDFLYTKRSTSPGTYSVTGLYAGDNNGETSSSFNKESLITKDYYSSVRFFAGATFFAGIDAPKSGKFVVLEDGSLYAGAAEISGGYIGNFTIKDGKIYSGKSSMNDPYSYGVYIGSDGISVGGSAYNDNGVLKYRTINLDVNSGTLSVDLIYANGGTIGSWVIDSDGIHTTSGVFKYYNYAGSTGSGYVFTVLSKSGLYYKITSSNSYSGTLVLTTDPYTGITFSSSPTGGSGGGGSGGSQDQM